MSKGGFFERWSRRKLGEAEEAEEAVDSLNEPQAEPLADAPEEELDEAELARLPSIESFTLETDLAPFLRKGVPHALRNAAMRKMWMLDPAIRDHKDLAVDYAWDWNTPGGVPGNAGTISRDSVARMLESLNPKREEAVASEEPGSAAESVEAADASPAAQEELPQEAADNGPEAAQTGDRMARPRRHGGAAPV